MYIKRTMKDETNTIKSFSQNNKKYLFRIWSAKKYSQFISGESTRV